MLDQQAHWHHQEQAHSLDLLLPYRKSFRGKLNSVKDPSHPPVRHGAPYIAG